MTPYGSRQVNKRGSRPPRRPKVPATSAPPTSIGDTRRRPQSAGPNCEPDEARGRPQPEAYVGVRAERPRHEARAEWIGRSQVGPALASSHRAEEVRHRGKAHHGIPSLLVADGGGGATVVVAGEDHRLVGEGPEARGERGVHLLGIAPGQIGAPAGADEQRVPGDEAAVHEEALRAGSVPWGVDEGDRPLPYLKRVAPAHLDQIGAVAAQEL